MNQPLRLLGAVAGLGLVTAGTGVLLVKVPILLLLGGLAALVAVVTLATRPRSSACAWLLLLAIAAMTALPIMEVSTGRLIMSTVIGFTVLAIIATIRVGNRALRAPIGILLAYLLVLACVTAFHRDPKAWDRLLPHALLAAVCLALGIAATNRDRIIVARGVISMAAAHSIYAIYEMLASPTPLWVYPVMTTDGRGHPLYSELLGGNVQRAQSTFGSPLPLAFFLVVAVGLTLTSVDNWRFRVLTLFLLVAGIVATGSRSALVIAVLLAAFRWARGTRTARTVAGVVLVVLVAVGLELFGFFTSGVVTRFIQSDSLSHRLGVLDALQRLWDQPLPQVLFGNGYYSLGRLFGLGLLQTDGYDTVDDQFVATFAVGGLVALGLVLALLWRATVRASDWRFVAATLAGAGMFFSFEVLTWPSTVTLMMSLIGMSATAPSECRKETDSRRSLPDCGIETGGSHTGRSRHPGTGQKLPARTLTPQAELSDCDRHYKPASSVQGRYVRR